MDNKTPLGVYIAREMAKKFNDVFGDKIRNIFLRKNKLKNENNNVSNLNEYNDINLDKINSSDDVKKTSE